MGVFLSLIFDAIITVGGEQEMRWVLSLQPSYFVDFFLDFQTFEIVELWFVTLEGAVDIVFASPGIRLFGLKTGNENNLN